MNPYREAAQVIEADDDYMDGACWAIENFSGPAKSIFFSSYFKPEKSKPLYWLGPKLHWLHTSEKSRIDARNHRILALYLMAEIYESERK